MPHHPPPQTEDIFQDSAVRLIYFNNGTSQQGTDGIDTAHVGRIARHLSRRDVEPRRLLGWQAGFSVETNVALTARGHQLIN